jgi:hypothetical protein
MGLLSLSLASCEKPLLHDEELEAYYQESLHLDAAPRDSVVRFSCKVQQYVSINPDATEDPLYTEIQEKIRLCLRLTDSSWGEDRTITFGGTATGDSNNVPDSGTVTSGSIVVDTAWAGHTYVHY